MKIDASKLLHLKGSAGSAKIGEVTPTEPI